MCDPSKHLRLVIYGSLIGKFKDFLTQLVTILQSLYAPLLNPVICGDIFNSVYFCSSDPEECYGLQDIEHVNSI
jgi:hypothetical protein